MSEQQRGGCDFGVAARESVLIDVLAGLAVPLTRDAGVCAAAAAARACTAYGHRVGSFGSSTHLYQ